MNPGAAMLLKSKAKIWLWIVAIKVFLVVIGPVALLAIILSVGAGSEPGAIPGMCAGDGDVAQVLATIRSLESGKPEGNYTVEAAGASASGAYQFVDGTWNGYGGYTHAADAPPDVQDAKAAEMVTQILDTYHGDVSFVPVWWYYPAALDNPALMDQVPRPAAGNTLTIRAYQERWMEKYHTLGDYATGGAGGGICYAAMRNFDGNLPDILSNCAAGWGGYRNGDIPYSAMRYSPASNYMHPAASLAYDQLYAAGLAAGFDLRGNGYRSADNNGEATRGKSCHGVGMAVDINVLVPKPTGPKYDSLEAVWASPEFAWLCGNAERFGFVVPRNAMPAGMQCGGVVGNGAGGCTGDTCGHFESWHIEAVGVAITHPDFAGTMSRSGQT